MQRRRPQTVRSIFAGQGASDLLQSQTHLAELSSDGYGTIIGIWQSFGVMGSAQAMS